jgi:hypothetical protein
VILDLNSESFSAAEDDSIEINEVLGDAEVQSRNALETLIIEANQSPSGTIFPGDAE